MSRFVPPRCPNRSCAMHRSPEPGFFQRRGCYQPKCRSEPVPRFHCKSCKRGFSFQTFRVDHRDHRPDANPHVFLDLASGVGLRQCARRVRLSSRGVQWKFRKLARALALLNDNLTHTLPGNRTYLLDEIESFVQSSILCVTMPLLIEKESMLLVATDVAKIRRKQKTGSWRARWLEQHEQQHGRRPDASRACVRGVLRRFKVLLGGARATLLTDLKSSYATLVHELFGEQLEHSRFSGKLPRTVHNPLFRINLTDAMLRDNLGRLRRRSWLHSKIEPCLALHLQLFACYRNWVRKRTNQDAKGRTPGVVLGLVDRELDERQVVAWRQDWGALSIHPASATGAETVRQKVA